MTIPIDSPKRKFWLRGEPLVWATGASLTVILLITTLLMLLVAVNGLGYFWPARLARVTLTDGTPVLGEIVGRERSPDGKEARVQFKIGNRDLYGLDFRWLDRSKIKALDYPAAAVDLERREHGNFYGFLAGVKADGLDLGGAREPWEALQSARRLLRPRQAEADALRNQMSTLSAAREQARLKILKLRHDGRPDALKRIAPLEAEGRELDARFNQLNEQLNARLASLRAPEALLRDAAGQEKNIPLADIVRAERPNAMSLLSKLAHAGSRLRELLFEGPREANTEGGLLPAIFGTVLLVFLMSLFGVPLGVIAAVYLREYAKEGPMVRLVRIAVNNLAGVPSIVYGVFGLGFFVYGLGGFIDRTFFPERLPAPTFGTGGLLWASLTLALLTVPVVIVATEEALAAVPRGIREGSLALGATKFQTLVRILLPMASPGIMTGLILAMARAAGEVAPLMIVGVVKLAPALPLDGQSPFLHLDRKFMHLAFHIFDVGFQSPNVEAAKPMVFVTTLLLLMIVVAMSALAIYFRNRMKKKFTSGAF